PVALGTDGASSNDSQNMFETLKAAALVQRSIVPPDQWPTAMDSLRMCWDGGARGLGQKIGRLASGFRADIVLLRTGDLRLPPQTHNRKPHLDAGDGRFLRPGVG